MTDKEQELQSAARKVGIGGYTRHVFLCTGPSCCTPETGLAAWEVLKKELKDNNLGSGPNACYRTKVGWWRSGSSRTIRSMTELDLATLARRASEGPR